MMTTDLEIDKFYFSEDSYIKSDLQNINLKGLAGGKLLRSKLVRFMGEIFALDEQSIIKLGRVVELVHNATLTHDDVIDNSHTRRGNPSIPALINNKKSVLLGDYMLAKALHELSDFENPKLTSELTLTLKDLVEGEWIQYENTNPYAISTYLYETLALKKTGSLFRWCFIAPLLRKDTNSPIYNDLMELGEQIGVIFQISDDIIDFNHESKKSYAIDFRNNNLNYVLHYVGLDHPELATKFLQMEDISELNKDEMEIIDQAIAKAKKTTLSKINRCNEIINKLSENFSTSSESSFDEIQSIVTLLQSRIF